MVRFQRGTETEGKMRKATLRLQPRETLVVQKSRRSHAVMRLIWRGMDETSISFAFGRHAQNTVLIVSPPVDGLVFKKHLRILFETCGSGLF